MDAAASAQCKPCRRNRGSVRRSRVVLAPRPWRRSFPPVRERQRWQERPLTGESTKETVKPLRGESRDVSAVPVKPVCVLLTTIAHGAAGAVGARLSLRPLFKRGRTNLQNPGKHAPRE